MWLINFVVPGRTIPRMIGQRVASRILLRWYRLLRWVNHARHESPGGRPICWRQRWARACATRVRQDFHVEADAQTLLAIPHLQKNSPRVVCSSLHKSYHRKC